MSENPRDGKHLKLVVVNDQPEIKYERKIIYWLCLTPDVSRLLFNKKYKFVSATEFCKEKRAYKLISEIYDLRRNYTPEKFDKVMNKFQALLKGEEEDP